MVTYRCVAESISKLHGPSTLLRGKLPTSESKNAGRPNRREKERKMHQPGSSRRTQLAQISQDRRTPE